MIQIRKNEGVEYMKINQYEFLRDGKPFEPTREEIIQFAEHELAEKDKEIERLKYQLLYSQVQTPKEEIDKFNMAMAIQSLDYTSQIRHKVCDEIREKIEKRIEAYPIICEDENGIVRRCVFLDNIKDILDQIEKGERDGEV